MSRSLSATFSSAITGSVVEVFLAVDLNFTGTPDSPSVPLYLWTGYGDLLYMGKTYLGTGLALNISSVEETTEIEAKGANITLSGIPSSVFSLALSEPYQGRECVIYLGVKTSTGSIEFVEVFSGELDQMNILEASDTATVAVTAENVLIKLERPIVRRFTSEDQKSRYPYDLGLDFVAALQDKEIYWGRKAS